MASNPIKWGIEGGVNFSKIKSYDFKYTTSFKLGAIAEYNLPIASSSSFLLSTGAFLIEKGGKIDDYIDLKLKGYYLEIPLHVGYKQRLSADFNLKTEIGPYFAYGLFGKTKQGAFEDNKGEKFSEEKYNTFDVVKRFDAGIGFKFGIEYNDMIQLSWGMDFGLLKAIDEINKNAISKGQNFNTYLTLGVLF